MRPTEVGIDEWRDDCYGEKQGELPDVRDEEQKAARSSLAGLGLQKVTFAEWHGTRSLPGPPYCSTIRRKVGGPLRSLEKRAKRLEAQPTEDS